MLMERTTVALDGRDFSLNNLHAVQGHPEPGGLTARVTMSGVCGTDAHRLSGDVTPPDYRYAFGHEPVGVVHEVGAAVTDARGRTLRSGDRVLWFPASAACGTCAKCHAGDRRNCEREPWPSRADQDNPAGYQTFAALSPFVETYRIDESLPDEAYVALGCALPTAVCGMDRLDEIQPGQTVLIQGSGPVGLASTLLAARTKPSQLIVLGAPDERLAWARRFGATTTIDLTAVGQAGRAEYIADLTSGRGVDVVIEAAGRPEAFAEGLELLARDGRYLISGLYSGRRTVAINPVIINNRRLTIIGNLGATNEHRQRAVELVPELEAEFAISGLVSHRFGLDRLGEAIRSAADGSSTKSVIVP